tara:strand:+ start:951 stop:1202 length:252 start_codon:yes stop_codon:yes gene_type:complete
MAGLFDKDNKKVSNFLGKVSRSAGGDAGESQRQESEDREKKKKKNGYFSKIKDYFKKDASKGYGSQKEEVKEFGKRLGLGKRD